MFVDVINNTEIPKPCVVFILKALYKDHISVARSKTK